jgi:hypothetical protein
MHSPDEDNCAVRADGSLKEASEISWHHSLSDEAPIVNNWMSVDAPVLPESAQEATHPQREAGKRQIKLTQKLQQQSTIERFAIAGECSLFLEKKDPRLQSF